MGAVFFRIAMHPKQLALVEVLQEARRLLAQPDNDFSWSSWETAAEALQEIDGLVGCIESGDLPERSAIEFLFLPAGPIQEVSLSSGFAQEFVELANRADAALAGAYRTA